MSRIKKLPKSAIACTDRKQTISQFSYNSLCCKTILEHILLIDLLFIHCINYVLDRYSNKCTYFESMLLPDNCLLVTQCYIKTSLLLFRTRYNEHSLFSSGVVNVDY